MSGTLISKENLQNGEEGLVEMVIKVGLIYGRLREDDVRRDPLHLSVTQPGRSGKKSIWTRVPSDVMEGKRTRSRNSVCNKRCFLRIGKLKKNITCKEYS